MKAGGSHVTKTLGLDPGDLPVVLFMLDRLGARNCSRRRERGFDSSRLRLCHTDMNRRSASAPIGRFGGLS